ncbi:hypothetical protein SOM22_16870 [Stenotrophomonas rhizophila]|uniref:hypothetical protein n=1 Tax=Stenotrophomonas rhizophila TaxID=216778 RepID=UPI0028AC3881|nr:hypothetical protein [Stenotrophomonas rhizophila]MDY0956253.1 hypothetical protein [Stenotrophomonas rhizophila]
MQPQATSETVLGLTDLQIKFGTAAGQLALAAAVAYVAWQQWRTARNKLKSDLFERRFKLVRALRYQVDRVSAHTADAKGMFALPDLAREAGLLFNGDIKAISQKLVEALRLVNARQALLRENHETRITQERLLEETKAVHPDLNHESIFATERALQDTISTLVQISEDLKRARDDVRSELKKLDDATTEFLTLRH